MSIECGKNLLNMSSTLKAGGLACALACACLAPVLIAADLTPAYGQSASGDLSFSDIPEDAKLILTADDLIYNNDRNLIIASGGIQINYGPYQLVAERVEYNQQTGRMQAIGNVELLEPNGNRIFADQLDVTDNFSEGFINALRIETPDNTRIAASSAERQSGDVTVFNNGIYTACPKCEKNPDKPPFWQIKARKVVANGLTNTTRFEGASFEFLGIPIAFLPSLEIASHQAKRKTGFLIPSAAYSSELGASLSVPYHFALAPHMDATLTTTGYSKQGFMAELEFRQKFEAGDHVLTIAGMNQFNRSQFDKNAGHATVDGQHETRGFIASRAEFDLNSRWQLGWNVMLQSDANFARTYNIEGYDAERQTSEIYLSGLGSRSSFDLRAYHFDVQKDDIGDVTESQQATVYPVLDYNRIFSDPETGSELSFIVNAQHLSRDTAQTVSGRNLGLKGDSSRITTEAEWKQNITLSNGLVLTPLLAARGDFNNYNIDTPPAGLASGTSQSRGMLTAGLEARYPVLIQQGGATHVVEPIAQIFTRTNETLSGGLPNEDAQAFVFGASNLFERDKFSGFDRIEGGTRANVGVRYTGTFANGLTANALFGQSYHIAGLNSFAQTDLTGAGADSGLETDVSDYVGAVGVSTPEGFALDAAFRLDEHDFEVKRSDLTASFTNDVVQAGVTHSRIAAQTGYGSATDREEISANASLKFDQDWRVFGRTTYDLDQSRFASSAVGLEYHNACYAITGVYNHTNATATEPSKWSVGVRMSFKTLGDVDLGENAEGHSF